MKRALSTVVTLLMIFTLAICFLALTACGSNAENIGELDTPIQKEETTMDWEIFESIGVNSADAKAIFTKLGITYLTNLNPVKTNAINYQMFPYGETEIPLEIMVENGEITQVTLRHIHVAEGARSAFFDEDILPETWYYKEENGYKIGTDYEIGIIMYDVYLYQNSYYIGVNWEDRELYYFD